MSSTSISTRDDLKLMSEINDSQASVNLHSPSREMSEAADYGSMLMADQQSQSTTCHDGNSGGYLSEVWSSSEEVSCTESEGSKSML